jgi:hypothetical protein
VPLNWRCITQNITRTQEKKTNLFRIKKAGVMDKEGNNARKRPFFLAGRNLSLFHLGYIYFLKNNF